MRPELQPKDYAKDLLLYYFALQRRGLGDRYLHNEQLAHIGWTLADHAYLVQVLGDGCHNLPEVIESNSADPLLHECRWLYEKAEDLVYPAIWDVHDPVHAGTHDTWRSFWNVVAEVVGRPPRYGRPYEKRETVDDAFMRLNLEAHRQGLIRSIPFLPRLLWRLSGVIISPPIADPEKAFTPWRTFTVLLGAAVVLAILLNLAFGQQMTGVTMTLLSRLEQSWATGPAYTVVLVLLFSMVGRIALDMLTDAVYHLCKLVLRGAIRLAALRH